MGTVADVLALKGDRVYTISPSATVLEATQVMNRHKIGALVVEDAGRVVGIFTERDVLRRVVAEEKSPSETAVEEVMTRDVACASPETGLEEVAAVMKNRRIRHLPVCSESGGLAGMISIGDLNAFESHGQETTIRWMSEYIHGSVR